MGLVYLALDLAVDRDVVIKVLAPHWAEDPEAAERFAREGQRLAALHHPNIVRFYELGEDQGERFIAMEYVRGESLRHFLRRQPPLPLRTFVPIAAQILAGAGYAHEHGLMLRDIKPSNIMLCEHEGKANFVKLLDFGLAKLVEGREAEVTKSYAVGTAGYLAPELIRGERGDARVDVYALGVLFFRMLTGESPIVGDNDGALLYNHVHCEPRAISSWLPQPNDIPPPLVALITQCLSKDPRERPASANDVRAGLLACVSAELFALPRASAESRRAVEAFEQTRHQTGPHSTTPTSETWKRAQVGESRRRSTVLMVPPPPPVGASYQSGSYDALPGYNALPSDAGSPTRIGSTSMQEYESPLAAVPVWDPSSIPPRGVPPTARRPNRPPDEIEVEFDETSAEPRPRRSPLVYLGIGVGVLALLAVALMGAVVAALARGDGDWAQRLSLRGVERADEESPEDSPKPASAPAHAEVTIEAPGEARIRIDGGPAVLHTFRGPIPAGSHRVLVEAEGFDPWSLEFEVVAGTPLVLKPSLSPRVPAPQQVEPEARSKRDAVAARSERPARAEARPRRTVVKVKEDDLVTPQFSLPAPPPAAASVASERGVQTAARTSVPEAPKPSDALMPKATSANSVFLPVGQE